MVLHTDLVKEEDLAIVIDSFRPHCHGASFVDKEGEGQAKNQGTAPHSTATKVE